MRIARPISISRGMKAARLPPYLWRFAPCLYCITICGPADPLTYFRAEQLEECQDADLNRWKRWSARPMRSLRRRIAVCIFGFIVSGQPARNTDGLSTAPGDCMRSPSSLITAVRYGGKR